MSTHVVFPTSFYVKLVNASQCSTRILQAFELGTSVPPDVSCTAVAEPLPFLMPSDADFDQ